MSQNLDIRLLCMTRSAHTCWSKQLRVLPTPRGLETWMTFLTAQRRMESIEDLKALQGIQDELVQQGLMKAPSDAKLAAKSKAKSQKMTKKRRKASPGGVDSPYRVYTSPSGLQILIGRNNIQNDEISTRVANGVEPRHPVTMFTENHSGLVTEHCHVVCVDGDVWMHARSVPGSHLIIRVPAGSAATNEDVQYAANLSAYFSKVRDSGKCDVTMTDAKNVKKPKGAKPGQVLVTDETVVTGFPGNSAAAE